MQSIQLKLDRNAVAAPAQQITTIAAQVVAACFAAFKDGDLIEPGMDGEFMGYRFSGLEMTSDERRTMYQDWLLSKGLHELARGVRGSLEEAILYLAFIARAPSVTTLEEIDQEAEAIRSRAKAMSFPALMEEVSAGLTERLTFEEEFRSIQNARNCLEHRGGIVGARDLDGETDTLTLSFPRMKMFYERDGEEVELEAGHVIDAQESELGGVQILGRMVTRSKSYALGDRVEITSRDFNEIAMACHVFAGDLAGKLPTLAPESDPDADG